MPSAVQIVAAGTLTDRSGSIAAGDAAQDLAAANPNRRYLLIQNVSDTVLWVNFGTTAVKDQPSYHLKACGTAADGTGGVLEFNGPFCPTGVVSIIGASTGKKFVAKEG